MRTVPFELAQKLTSICFDDYTQNAYATKAGIEYSPLLTNSVLTTKIGSLIYNYEYCNIDDDDLKQFIKAPSYAQVLEWLREYDIDIMKVILMLAVHELGETVIGDLTQFDISKEEKEIIEHEAVSKILSGILDGKEIENLFLEFDSHSTKEAMFAYMCDKLECDLQCKLYDEEGCVDLNKQDGNNTLNNKIVHELLASGASWSEMWLKFGQQIYPYDDNFRSISNYAITHKLRK